jgi:tRNA (guanine37-N1)-methyltransferase
MQLMLVTLFPEMLTALTRSGVTSRACDLGLVQIGAINPRDYAFNKHKSVDDRPYGGGPGMVMAIEPLRLAIDEARKQAPNARVVYMSPQGQPLTQERVKELASNDAFIFVAGRYEGIDERLIAAEVDEEISIGDYVLSGGELPAMVVMDAVCRWVPGVLGHDQSAEQDSFVNGLLDCEHYTRPEVYKGQAVPDVLLSGNHERIRKWRLQRSLVRTLERRPDLMEQRELTREEKTLLDEYLAQQQTD